MDTAGVMRSLPQKQLADTIKGGNPYDEGKPFPQCGLIPPNSASLRGFRTLLLQRKKLSEQVQQSGQDVDKDSLQSTKMYEALQMRFKSMFIWPAFLAIFMPREAEEAKDTPERTPSKLPQLNLNRRMNVRGKLLPGNLKTPTDQENSNTRTNLVSTRWSIPGTCFLPPDNPATPVPPCQGPSITPRMPYQPSLTIKGEASLRTPAAPFQQDNVSLEMAPRKPLPVDKKIAPPTRKRSRKAATPDTRSAASAKTDKTTEGSASKRKLSNSKEKTKKVVHTSSASVKQKNSKQRKIWSRRTELTDEKLSQLVNNYISERKEQENIAVLASAKKNKTHSLNSTQQQQQQQQHKQSQGKVAPSTTPKKSTAETTVVTSASASDSNVFVPLRVLEPPGEKRPMFDNTVVALDTEVDGKTSCKKPKRE